MNYTEAEIKEMVDNLTAFMQQETIEHFRTDPMTGKVIRYEIPMSYRLLKQLGIISGSIKNLLTYEDRKNITVGSPRKKPPNDRRRQVL